MTGRTIVDVVIPIYNGFHVVEPCVGSAIQSAPRNSVEIIAIDDASTDPKVKAYLRSKSDLGEITLYENEINLGFTRTVNRGMRLHQDRDVILLNSDTLVFDDWADRMCAAAYSDRAVATVNPLTSSSHISNYPHRDGPNADRLEVDYEALDRLAREGNQGLHASVHTTVGFCMFIKRACIEQIGVFDAVHFPVGYGEESDFCYRARKVGWRHLVTGDVFVPHLEGQSFGERKRLLMEAMLSKFAALHPELSLLDGRFRRQDPVRPLRAGLDLARLKRLVGGRAGLSLRVLRDGEAFTATPEALTLDYRARDASAQLSCNNSGVFPNLERYRIPQDILKLNAALSYLGVRRVICDGQADFAQFASRIESMPLEIGLNAELVMRAPFRQRA